MVEISTEFLLITTDVKFRLKMFFHKLSKNSWH